MRQGSMGQNTCLHHSE